MVTLYLKYSNDKWLTESADSFKTLYFKKYKTRESIQGSTLRSILFQHKLAVKSNNALVIISANELYQASKKTYIENLERDLGVPITLIGTGQSNEAMIDRRK